MDFCRAFVSIIVFGISSTVCAHSGGLDADGCHAGSQPYHCHNGSSSSGSASPGSLSMRDLAIISTVSYGIYSGYQNFNSPIQLSLLNNNSGIGVGASFINSRRSWFSSSKVFDESSVINFGMIEEGLLNGNYDLFYGAGIHTHLHEGAPTADEENELNLNVGVAKNIANFSLFMDLDSGPGSLSIGVASRF